MGVHTTPTGVRYWDEDELFGETTGRGRGPSLIRDMALSVDAAISSHAVETTQAAARKAAAQIEDELFVEVDTVDAAGGLVTEAEQRTWLEFNDRGAPTQTSVRLAAPALAEQITPRTLATAGLSIGADELHPFAVTDETGQISELALDATGRVPDQILSAWRRRMDKMGAGTVRAIVQHGDSMTEGRDPAHLSQLTGVPVVQDGAGGETSVGISARANANPLLIDPCTVPADTTPTTVTYRTASQDVSQWMLLQGGRLIRTHERRGMPGAIVLPGGERIEGILWLVQDTPSSLHRESDRYEFSRSTPGEPVTITRPAPFLFQLGEQTRSHIQVIWAGQNDMTPPAWGKASDRVLMEIEAMLEHTGRGRYLILGITTGTNHRAGDPGHTARVEHNARLAQFGRRFLDVRRYLIDWGLQDAGLSPTPEDLADIAADTIPRSLLSDGLHLTLEANKIVDRLIADRLRELGDL